MMDVECSYCGHEDGRFRYGPVGGEEAIGEACIALVLRDLEDQRQALIFDARWQTIQGGEPSSWLIHMWHRTPASGCSLCTAESVA